jgi:predicted nucleic acid-binding protein
VAGPGLALSGVIAVADASPLHYLVLIGHIDLLPALFSQILVPPSVLEELRHQHAPKPVRAWATVPPTWLECQVPEGAVADLPRGLGPGERDTLALAATLHPAVVLIDERDGRREARRRGWPVMGTLGLLRAATDRQVEGLNLAQALGRLRHTNFRASDAVFAAILRGILEKG